MTTYNDTPAIVSRLSRALGSPDEVSRAILRCEGQATPNPTNPLNVRYWARAHQLEGPGANGTPGVGFAAYQSPAAGIDDAIAMLRSLVHEHANGYAAILAAVEAWQAHPDQAHALGIARAWELSSWAAGHYGGTADRPGCIRTYLTAHPVTSATPPASGAGEAPPVSRDRIYTFPVPKGVRIDTKAILAAGTPDTPPDMSGPSSDAVGLLNQWLWAERHPSGELAWQFGNETERHAQIVQLVAQVLAAGAKVYGGYSLHSRDVALAQSLNGGPANRFALTPAYAKALAAGLPK